jgi:nicotinate-nucleotide adenylyltransferase
MVRAAAQGDERFEVCTLELERTGPSYTVDTVRALRSDLPDDELFLMLGADQFRDFERWRDPGAIKAEVRLAVMQRGTEAPGPAASVAPAPARVIFVSVTPVDLSSTDVRDRVRAGGDVSGLVPPGVLRVIRRDRLYRDP